MVGDETRPSELNSRTLENLRFILKRIKQDTEAKIAYVLRGHSYYPNLQYPVASSECDGAKLDPRAKFYLFPYNLDIQKLREAGSEIRIFDRDRTLLHDIARYARLEAYHELDEELPRIHQFRVYLDCDGGTPVVLVISGDSQVGSNWKDFTETRYKEAVKVAWDLVQRFLVKESAPEASRTMSDKRDVAQIQRYFLRVLSNNIQVPYDFPFLATRVDVEGIHNSRLNTLALLSHVQSMDVAKSRYLHDMKVIDRSYWDQFHPEKSTTDRVIQAMSHNLAGDWVHFDNHPSLNTSLYARYNFAKPFDPSIIEGKDCIQSQGESATTWDLLRRAMHLIGDSVKQRFEEAAPGRLAQVIVWAKTVAKKYSQIVDIDLFPLLVSAGTDAKALWTWDTAVFDCLEERELYGGRIRMQVIPLITPFSGTKADRSAIEPEIDKAEKLLHDHFDPAYLAAYKVRRTELNLSHHLRTLAWQQGVLVSRYLDTRPDDDSYLLRVKEQAKRIFSMAEFLVKTPSYSGSRFDRQIHNKRGANHVPISEAVEVCFSDVLFSYDRYDIPMTILTRQICDKQDAPEHLRRLDMLYQGLQSNRPLHSNRFLEMLQDYFKLEVSVHVDEQFDKLYVAPDEEAYHCLLVVFRNFISNALKYTKLPKDGGNRQIGMNLRYLGNGAEALGLEFEVTNGPACIGRSLKKERSENQLGLRAVDSIVESLNEPLNGGYKVEAQHEPPTPPKPGETFDQVVTQRFKIMIPRRYMFL